MIDNLMDQAGLFPVNGIRISTCHAGLYNNKRDDLSLIEVDPGSNCSAVFTKNWFCAAPVVVARKNISVSKPRYLIINAGNANAGMGEQGIQDAYSLCNNLADLAGCDMENILPFSTGVIGERLPVDKIIKKFPELLVGLDSDNWHGLARAITTTDTKPKSVSKQITINGSKITFTGVAKGSGMIKPDMATMLAYIATDAVIDVDILDLLLHDAVNESFNCITVDGDTSTNDACVLIATNMCQMKPLTEINCEIFIKIKSVLTDIFVFLAKEIIRDGEGATKFIEIHVKNGITRNECEEVAYNIAHSPLVKTAMFASDPNWGRILAAIGKTDLTEFNIRELFIYINGVCIVSNGERSAEYNEDDGVKIMQEREITICVDLNRGSEEKYIWTSDLSYEYVRINAEYRS